MVLGMGQVVLVVILLFPPVGIATVAKGLSKIGRGTYSKAGLSEAYDDYAAGGLRGVASGATNRSIGGKMDDLLQRGQARKLQDFRPVLDGGTVSIRSALSFRNPPRIDRFRSTSFASSQRGEPAIFNSPELGALIAKGDSALQEW